METKLVKVGVFTLILAACVVHAQTDAEQESTLPDLRVLTLSASPKQPCAGETTQVIVELGNTGSGAATEFTATITIGSEKPIPVPIPGLAGKQSTTVALEYEFAAGDATRVVVEMDSKGQVEEHDESNNRVYLDVKARDCEDG